MERRTSPSYLRGDGRFEMSERIERKRQPEAPAVNRSYPQARLRPYIVAAGEEDQFNAAVEELIGSVSERDAAVVDFLATQP